MAGDEQGQDDGSAEWFAAPAVAEEVDMLRHWVAGLSTELARAREERDAAQRELANVRAELAAAQVTDQAGSAPLATPPAAHDPVVQPATDADAPSFADAPPAPVVSVAPESERQLPPAPAESAGERRTPPEAIAFASEYPTAPAPAAPPAPSGPRAAAAALLRRLGLSLALVLLAGVLLLGVGPRLLPYQVYVMQSESMAPAIGRGALVVVWPTEAAALWPGDVIVFRSPADRAATITHRVIGVTLGVDGVVLQTQGDANPAADPWLVQPDAVRGKVIATLPLLGYPLLELASAGANRQG